MNIRGILPIAALAALPILPPVVGHMHDPHPAKACVTYFYGFRTPTGHEADEPMQMCGTGAKGDMQCEGNQPPGPGARFECYAIKG